jgi:hypothetical protein
MYKKAIRIPVILGGLVWALVLIIGCASTPSPQPAASPVPTRGPEATAFPSVLPTPDRNETLTSVLPTPDPDSAVVAGVLIGATSGEPVTSMLVFLERTPQTHTVPPVLYGPPNDQPRATTNEAGQFVITGVPDGEYVLVLFSPPLDLQVAIEPSSDQPLFVTAQPGSVNDVGVAEMPDY